MYIFKLFEKYKTEIMLIIAFIIFILLFLFDKNNQERKYEGIDKQLSLHSPFISKAERKCKEIVEQYYNLPFRKIRPNFLKHKKGRNLELDIYNDDLKLAIEVNGRQHREFCPRFHKNYSDFEEQLERDKFKNDRCKEVGIYLITISDKIKYDELEKYLKMMLKEFDEIRNQSEKK